MNKSETFLFENQIGLYDGLTIETNVDTRENYIKFTKGVNKLKGVIDNDLEIDFGWDNSILGKNNREELRRFAVALFEATKSPGMRLTPNDVMTKIKVRVVNYKYLKEYLSLIELCYVEFSDKTCAIIGHYVKTLTGSDCIFIDKLLVEEIDFAYNLDGMGVQNSLVKYFKSVEDKDVTKVLIAASPILVQFVKDNYSLTIE